MGTALYSFSTLLGGFSKERCIVCLLQSSAGDNGSNFILKFCLQLIISHAQLI